VQKCCATYCDIACTLNASTQLNRTQAQNTSKSASMSHLIYQTSMILYTFWSVCSSSQAGC